MNKPKAKLKHKIKNSNLIVILPMIGVGVAYVLLLYLPNFREMNKQRDIIQYQQNFISKSELLKGEISDIEAKVQRTQEFCKDWEALAPIDADIPQIHRQINDCVSLAGASVTGFDPLPTVPMNTVDRVPLIVRATGSFAQIYSMLAKLESMPESIWLENLKLKAAGKDAELMNCEVTLVVFAKKSEKSD